MANPRDLKYRLQILHKGEILAESEVDANAEVLNLIREREFNMLHSIIALANRVLPIAIKEYDFNKNLNKDGINSSQ